LWTIHIPAHLLYQNDNGVSAAVDRRSRSADTLASRNGSFVDRDAIHDYPRLDLIFL